MQKQERALVPFGSAPGVPALAAAELELRSVELAKEGKAPNTRRAYESDWASWVGFCEAQNFVPLPADPDHVKLYLTHLTTEFGRAGKKLRPRTAERHLAAIATTHCALGLTFDRHGGHTRRRTKRHERPTLFLHVEPLLAARHS